MKVAKNLRRALIVAVCVVAVCVMAVVCFGAHNANAANNNRTYQETATGTVSTANLDDRTGIAEYSALSALKGFDIKNVSIVSGEDKFQLIKQGTTESRFLVPTGSYLLDSYKETYTDYGSVTLQMTNAMKDSKGNLKDVYLTVNIDELRIYDTASENWQNTDSSLNVYFVPLIINCSNDKIVGFQARSTAYVSVEKGENIYDLIPWDTIRVNGNIKSEYSTQFKNINEQPRLDCKYHYDLQVKDAGSTISSPITSDTGCLIWNFRDLDVGTVYLGSDGKVYENYIGDYKNANYFDESIGVTKGFQKAYFDNQKTTWLKQHTNNNGKKVAVFSNSKETETDESGVVDVCVVSNVGEFAFDWWGYNCGSSILSSEDYYGGIQLQKTSSISTYAGMPSLAGAQFEIYKSNKIELVKTITTDSNGMASSGDVMNLAAGTYYIKETKAPTGYNIDKSDFQEVTVTAGEWSTVSVSDTPKNYTITTSVENGTIDESCVADYGSSKTINYAPKDGYHLKSVTVDGEEIDITKYPSSYAFEDIAADHDIKVVYEKDEEPITPTTTSTNTKPSNDTGKSSGSSNNSSVAKTGDDNMLLIVGLLGLFVLAGSVGYVSWRRHAKSNAK